MIFNVRMIAHHDVNTVRPVYVPAYAHKTVEDLLDDVFKYGQNDFVCGPDAEVIRRTICSVSVGDVIELPVGGDYLVKPIGFQMLVSPDYENYKKMSLDDRWMYARS